MATNDIASLGIQVTTTGVDQAKRSLDDLAKSGDDAAQSVGQVGESADQARARLHEMVQQSTQAASGTAAITESQRSLAERVAETSAAITAQGKATVDWAAEQAAANARGAAINASAERAAKQAKAATVASIAEQRAELGKLVGQIDPTVAALGRLDAQQAKLAAFRKTGVLGAEDFAAYNAAIEANRIKVTAASGAMHQFSLNNALARRELGRMAADMANGNWGRFQQTSLTLANASGVLGLAFSGVGAIITGVVAAIGLGIIAFEKGSSEVSRFNKALIETGDIAGTTAAGLANMARNVALATDTTQHSASDAIAQVAATGKFTGSQIAAVAEAAQRMRDTTGQALKETIKQFESLADSPANAIVKLNDQQHFLTLSIYDQIKALEDQGQHQAAVDLAMQTYSSTIAERTPKVVENLGLIEQAWRGIKGAAEDAANAAMQIGRQDTDQQKFDNLAAQRERLVALQDKGWKYDPNLDPDSGSLSSKIASITAEMAKMQDARKAADVAASQQSAVQAANDAGIALSRQADVYASAEVKRARLIAKAHGDANEAIAKAQQVQDADLRNKLIANARANEQAIVAGIESHERKPRGNKSDPFASLSGLVQKAQVFDAGADEPKAQTEQVTRILAVVDAGAKLIASGKDVARVQAMVADGVSALNEGYAKQAAQVETRNLIAVQKYQAALDKQNEALQRSIDAQVDQLGMGDKDYRRQQQLTEVYQKNADALARLAVERAKIVADGKSTTAIDGEILAQQRNTDVQVKMTEDGFKRVDAAQASWQLGAIRAMANVRDEGAKVAGMTANVFTNAFSGMGDAIANFVKTGKLDFKSLADSIITDIVRMEARMMASKFASGILSSILGGGTEMATSFDSNGTFFSPWAKGGAIENSVSLSAYSGHVVDKPTLFAFARGAGVMGEAGPEAIMPLTRGPDGKLAVQAMGASALPPQVQVNITNKGQPVNATTTGTRQDGNRVIVDMVLDAVAGDMVRGGRTAKAMQQRFGLAQRGVPVGA